MPPFLALNVKLRKKVVTVGAVALPLSPPAAGEFCILQGIEITCLVLQVRPDSIIRNQEPPTKGGIADDLVCSVRAEPPPAMGLGHLIRQTKLLPNPLVAHQQYPQSLFRDWVLVSSELENLATFEQREPQICKRQNQPLCGVAPGATSSVHQTGPVRDPRSRRARLTPPGARGTAGSRRRRSGCRK